MQTSLLAVAVAALLGIGMGIGMRARTSRQRFRREADAFRCRFRARGTKPAAWRRLGRRWSRPMWAVWAGDVLVVRRGPVFDRTVRMRATVTFEGVYVLPPGDAKRCGDHAIAVGLRVPDGSRVEVAAEEEGRVGLVGPYLAAAIRDLPKAPAPGARHDVRPDGRNEK